MLCLAQYCGASQQQRAGQPRLFALYAAALENRQVFAVHPKLVSLDGTIEAELSYASFEDKMIYPRQPHASRC